MERLEDRLLPAATIDLLKNLGDWENSVSFPIPAGNKLFFQESTFDGDYSDDLWVTDGTADGTVQLKQYSSLDFGLTSNAIGYHGSLYYSGIDQATEANGLWTSDGTTAGTRLVSDGPESITNFVIMNDRMYFVAYDAAHGRELWTSDGTAAGTHLVIDLMPGPDSGEFSAELVAYNDRLYFSGAAQSNNDQLWSTDGTAAGTALVGNFDDPTTGSNPTQLTVLNGHLLFTASTNSSLPGFNPTALWFSDGTFAGSQELVSSADGIAGTAATQIQSATLLGQVGNLEYFTAHTNDSATDWGLWVTDGTVNGTRFLKSLSHAEGGPFTYSVTAGANGLAYFGAGNYLDGTGNEPWVSDGTTAGTHLLKDIAAGSQDSTPGEFAAFDGQTYFDADDHPTHRTGGVPIWVSDGTTAGTVAVTNFGSESVPTYLTSLNGSLLMFVNGRTENSLYRLTSGSATSSAPKVQPQNFSLKENSPAGTLVGTVLASPGAAHQKLTYAITGGNSAGVFGINATTGQITVVDPSGLDYETHPAFTLKVKVAVSGSQDLMQEAEMSISLIDQAEGLPISLSGPTLTHQIGKTLTAIDSGATLVLPGAEGFDFNGVKLSVALVADRQPKDRLGIVSGGGSDQIQVKGKSIKFNGMMIATMAGCKGKQANLEITFQRSATVAAVQALLPSIGCALPPGGTNRRVMFQLQNLAGINSTAIGAILQV